MKNILYIIAAAVLLCGCESLQQNSRPEPASAGQYSVVPQKMDFQTVLATEFFKTIPWTKLKKSGFESQSQYIERLKAITLDDNPVFVEVDNDQIRHIYNAETKQLFLGVLREHLNAYGQPTSDCRFTISKSAKVTGHHAAQNSYGAKFDVTEMEGEELQFDCLNLFHIPSRIRPTIKEYYVDMDSIGFLIPMDGEEAKAALDSKSLCLVLSMKPTKIEWAGKYLAGNPDATLRDPITVVYEVFDLPVQVVAVKLINKSSGIVLASWSADTTSQK